MNITIVGGGTAGWLAALLITKIHRDSHTVTLIESSSIGIIGAGESSTGMLRGIINNEVWDYGCNEFEFMRYAKATPKLAILHKNWRGDGSEYLAPIDTGTKELNFDNNALLNAYIALDVPMQMSSINGRLEAGQLSSFFEEEGKIKHIGRHAYNFDARLAAKYIEKVCGNNISKIDAKVVKINFLENGFVKSLNLDNGLEIETDFVIDASGFARLFSKAMDVKWKEYKELTLDSAMPFILPYPQDYKLRLVATSWAQKHGWLWQIPKGDDLGNGYAFDSRYIDNETAQREVENLLGHEIEPIKFLRYQPGKLENCWNKNVLSIGLSSSFLEPLEATSIHGTIIQLNMFCFTYLKETQTRTINESSIKSYNRSINKMLDDFKTFILLHYCGGRQDTEFWRNAYKLAREDDKINEILEIAKTRLLNKSDLEYSFGYAGAELYNWILCGLGLYTKETALKELKILNRQDKAKDLEQWLINGFDSYNWIPNQTIFELIHKHEQ